MACDWAATHKKVRCPAVRDRSGGADEPSTIPVQSVGMGGQTNVVEDAGNPVNVPE